MVSPGRQLAAGSDLWPTAEKEGWSGVGHWPLAGGGESRRPKGVSNPRYGRSHHHKAAERRQMVSLGCEPQVRAFIPPKSRGAATDG
jgi:hypothetical protein